jgi:hypothetical protein
MLCMNLSFGTGKAVEIGEGEIREDDEAMRNMDHLGQTISWLGTAMASATVADPLPKIAVELHQDFCRPSLGNKTNEREEINQCKSANWETATWRSRPWDSAAWG